MPVDVEYEAVMKSSRDLLSFYGTELQSHASIVLGIALLIFAIIQAWIQLVTTTPKLASTYGIPFSVLIGFLALGLVYQMLRLYVYGKLTSALTGGSYVAFQDTKKEYVEVHGERQWNNLSDLEKVKVNKEEYVEVHGAEQWSHLTSLEKLNQFTDRVFMIGARHWLRLFNGRRPKYRVLFMSGVAGSVLSYVLIFGRV